MAEMKRNSENNVGNPAEKLEKETRVQKELPAESLEKIKNLERRLHWATFVFNAAVITR